MSNDRRLEILDCSRQNLADFVLSVILFKQPIEFNVKLKRNYLAAIWTQIIKLTYQLYKCSSIVAESKILLFLGSEISYLLFLTNCIYGIPNGFFYHKANFSVP